MYLIQEPCVDCGTTPCVVYYDDCILCLECFIRKSKNNISMSWIASRIEEEVNGHINYKCMPL